MEPLPEARSIWLSDGGWIVDLQSQHLVDDPVAVGTEALMVLQLRSMRDRHVLDLDRSVVDLDTGKAMISPERLYEI